MVASAEEGSVGISLALFDAVRPPGLAKTEKKRPIKLVNEMFRSSEVMRLVVIG